MLHFELSSVARRRDSESFDRYVAEAGRAVKAIADSPPGYLTTLDKGLWDIVVDTLARVAPPSKIVLLGIGGSALGARTLADALCPAKRDHLLVLDNIDPHTISQALSNEELATALFLAISKSGSTAETASQLLYFRQRMIAAGSDDWAQRVIAITDPERGPLRELGECTEPGCFTFFTMFILFRNWFLMSVFSELSGFDLDTNKAPACGLQARPCGLQCSPVDQNATTAG